MNHNRFDVIVVGGGPAGITAATALGKRGFSVLVCEAAVFPGAENWSGAVYFTENLESEEAFGKKAIEEGPVERRLTERGFYLYNGHSMLGAALKDPGVFRSSYTVLRPVFDRYLAELAREQGVVLMNETTVQSLIRHQGKVIGVHTERGAAYADVVFLAEGDASHLVTQEGYEQVSDSDHGKAPHFLQGIKEVVSLAPEVLEERFGLEDGAGGAYEMLLRNGTRGGRTVRLNMGGFMYTNRDSISLGLVLPVDNLARNFDGDHNLLMEWYKGLPEVARWIDGGEVTSYGTKIIRGGGIKEIPRLVDDGLVIGGAASGIGIDFPYPNFTGPATSMGLIFARAIASIAADNGGPGNGNAGVGDSPYTAAALEAAYLKPVQATHYYRNVERLKDWPDYIERTQIFFERQLDVINGAAFIMSRPDLSAPRRIWETMRLKRRVIGLKRIGDFLRDGKANAAALGINQAVRASLGIGTFGRWITNTVTSLLPGGGTTVESDGKTGVARARTSDGGEFRMVFSAMAGAEPAGRMPRLARWGWKRFGTAMGDAFSDVYTNDDEPLDTKLPRALGRLVGQVSLWDPLIEITLMLIGLPLYALQAGVEWLQLNVLGKDLLDFREQYVSKLLAGNRERLRLDDDAVKITTAYDHKLSTISYREGEHSHIKVMWPEKLADRGEITKSPLWSVCPAKVYEVQRHPVGMPGLVVNFDNCVKCETCWRATDDVHWSRATQQRLIYETYTPTHRELREYLLARPQPTPRMRALPPFWDACSEQFGAPADIAADAVRALSPVRAELARFAVAMEGYARALGDSPLALEEGERSYLEELAGRSMRRFAAAQQAWNAPELNAVRDHFGASVETLWADAAERVAEIGEHAGNQRYFWADVVGKQLRDHHLVGLDRMLDHAGADDGLALEAATWSFDAVTPEVARAWGDAWMIDEGRPRGFDAVRGAIREWCDDYFDSAVLRALEEAQPPADELRTWLSNQLSSAAEMSRQGSVIAGAGGTYGRRDVLLEELAAVDPSLAALAAQHLLAVDLVAGVEVEEAAALRAATQLATVVSQGSISNRPVTESEPAEGVAGTTGAELHGEAPMVLAALADWLLVVRDNRGYLVPATDPGVQLQDVGTVGLVGAGVRRAVFDGCIVPENRIFDIPTLQAGSGHAAPAAGEPFADTLPVAIDDHLAIVRGVGSYLTQRARDHAASRVQFPGAFQDEAGRDTIAKFGAVKQMLAEMESQRILVESLSVVSPVSSDAWVDAAVTKVLSADAFGPKPGSFGYNCGQVFGGTAFSEDDCIAKYYRDSSPFRFLIAHDDALRVEIGRRRLESVAAGELLIPISKAEAAWLDAVRDQGPLAAIVPGWEAACAQINEWASTLDAGGEGVLFHAGDLVARAVAVKVCIMRTAWRTECGLAAEATLEATAQLADRFVADAPGIIAEAGLLDQVVAVGADMIAAGDFEPAADIADAEAYDAVLATDFASSSGLWLHDPFDGERLRYVPEMLWNDDRLRAFRDSVEAQQRARYVEPRFDGLTYNRYLEKIHKIPQEDLDYLIEEGYMRMPIPTELGGGGALKAEYYTVCEMTGRYGDAALSLAIMANTSIGTTPFIIGLKQDLPRAQAELEKVKNDPALLGDIRSGLDGLIAGLERPDFDKLQAGYLELAGAVKKNIAKSAVLKYIGAGFLRAFFGAGKAGQAKDIDGFGAKLKQARGLIDDIVEGAEDRLREYPRRHRAHELFLKMISAGYTSAFALTEPTAGSDSGGVKTTAKPDKRRVHEDDNGVLYFFLDEENQGERRNLLDADRLEFDFDAKRLLYRWSDDAEASVIEHDEYDYEKDSPAAMRTYMHGGEKVAFTDIAEIRVDDNGDRWYEFWELNGAKMWITNGRFAHMFALYAKTEPEGVTGFMVDRHSEGLVVGSDEEKLGQRGSPTNELSLSGVRVPRECIIGFRGRGQVNALETLNTGRTGLSVATRSTIQEMMEDAIDFFADDSVADGPYPRQAGEATELQRYWVGRLAEEMVCTGSVAHELIGLFDHPLTKDVRMESAIGKYWNSESEHDGIEYMERMRGLDGLTHRHRIEKTRRDARVLNIYEGTNEVQRYLLLRDLAQRVLPTWRAGDSVDAPAAVSGGHYPELQNRLEAAKHTLMLRLDEADKTLGALVWANVNLQPCFFRLAEIAGLIKVMDAVLYRLEWLAGHDVPDAYRDRVARVAELALERCFIKIEGLDRRFVTSFAYLKDDRYPPDVQLGFLSLDPNGAVAESLGTSPAMLQARAQGPLARSVRIAVLVKPVPVVAPRPRFADDTFAESLYDLDAVDMRSLGMALDLKRRDPDNVTIAAYAVAGVPGVDVLQRATAMGADEAVLLEAPEDAEVLHDSTAVARMMARALEREPADLVLCGAEASDTGQGVVAPMLAGILDREHVDRAQQILWADGAEPVVRAMASGWQGHELDVALPCVVAVDTEGDHRHLPFDLGAFSDAATTGVTRLSAADLGGFDTMPVWHRARGGAGGDGPGEVATTPEAAAELLLEIAGLSDAAASVEADPYTGDPSGFGQQPDSVEPACLFVCDAVAGDELPANTAEALNAAAALAAGSELPLDVVLPLADKQALPAAVGQVIGEVSPRRVFVISNPDLVRFGWRGQLEWLQEFWGMYRGDVRWLLGSPSMNTLFARFAGHGPPGVDRSWPWFDVQTVGNGSGPLRLGSTIFDGAGQALAAPPLQSGLRIATFAPGATVDLEGPEADGETQVYLYEPRVEYSPEADQVAALLDRLGGAELTLSDAEYIVDVGYGAGSHDDLQSYAEPLLELLRDELGLSDSMIGATRKVTQDLETLPDAAQIGQTGVRVEPKVLVALAVSGAPQHVDWIGDAAVVLSFNTDPGAPLMKLNEQRATPVVHPIVGDVKDTVPRFIAALRDKVGTED